MTDDKRIDADQVVAWLCDHPDFFTTHEDLLEQLQLPKERGQAVSLLERQARVMRDRNAELRQRLETLLETGRTNDALFEKVRRLTLVLAEAESANQLFQALLQSLRRDFGVDAAALLIYDRDLDLSVELQSSVRCLPVGELPEAVQLMLRKGKAVCGSLRPEEVEALFPRTTGAVTSAAMVPLDYHGKQGLLAIGSFNPQHFSSSLDTLFISYLGDMLARRLHSFLQKYPRLEARRA